MNSLRNRQYVCLMDRRIYLRTYVYAIETHKQKICQTSPQKFTFLRRKKNVKSYSKNKRRRRTAYYTLAIIQTRLYETFPPFYDSKCDIDKNERELLGD